VNDWFEDIPVIGNLPLRVAANKLEEIGDIEAAQMLLAAAPTDNATGPSVMRGGASLWPFQNRPWQHTSHAFGYIAPGEPVPAPGVMYPITHAGNIASDYSIQGKQVKVTLSGLRAAAYPGRGNRRVLFDFSARNQLRAGSENLHFNATFRIAEHGHAAVLGYPLFVGLTVGSEGLQFKCFTVNVANERDDAFLTFLESEPFRAGLKLTRSLQPAMAPLAAMAYNLTRNIAKRNRNVPVQEFYLGLDFAKAGVGARLAEGTYIAVQMSEMDYTLWNWDRWVYDPFNGRIVGTEARLPSLPHNYVTFSVVKFTGT
jgi:hypothetical protein